VPPKHYGSGSVTRKGDRWQVCVWLDGRRVYRTAPTEAEAEAIRRQLVARKQRGKLRPDPPRTRLDALLARWLATKEPPAVLPRAYAVYERRVRLYVTPSLGHLRAADLSPLDVEAWLRELVKAGLSETTIKQCRSLLSEALDWAVDRELLTRNPARRVRAPRATKPAAVKTPPTREEAVAFLGAVSGHRLAALWHLAASLGLRRGELLGLTWAAVDLERAELRVDTQLVREGGAWTLPDPKSKSGRRTLPLADPLPALLARRRVEQLEERLRAPTWGPDLGLVFTTEAGRPINPDAVRVIQKGIARSARVENIDLHRSRHGVATLLLGMDAPARIIQAFLGHTAKTTTERYQTPSVALLRPYAERIAGYFEYQVSNPDLDGAAIERNLGG
jgi:integrase